MSNISATLEKTGTIHNLLHSIDKVLEREPKALTILAADGNNFTKPILDPILMSLDVPVSGAIFPKLIFKDKLLDKGSIVIAWYNDISITNYKNIENTDSIKDLVGIANHSQSQSQNQQDIGEYLIFIDGAVPKFEDNLGVLYKKIGFRATFAGGGAGSLSSVAIPCIISNDGLLSNAMQTVATNHKSKVTTTHGWQKQSGPHLVTSSNKSNLKTINYEPVIAFYKKHNSLFRDHNLKDTEFSSYFNQYPLGIENIDGELLVREPIKYTEDSIEYIGSTPEYSKIHILTGTKDSAREEVDKELKSIKLSEQKNIDATFVFSCARRDDADQNGDSKEVKMLNKHLTSSKHVIGSLSLGEIATGPSRLLHLHNKSIVISQLSGEL